MAAKSDNDDDSFIIILGTSPGTSMDVEKCNGVVNGEKLDQSQIEDAMKDLPAEANMAFKAKFNLGDSPSPASMMVASTLITDDRSTEELQKRFGELLDENVVLKETLKQNNDSMKEQFMLIASCQEDMLKTHRFHKEKFDETRALVERLRQENMQLKLDLSRVAEGQTPVNCETGEGKSGASSGVEFVTSPEDDTIDKLTSQLELVEKQRRQQPIAEDNNSAQVIVENEKLTWQKLSLEHLLDAASKERDDLSEKLSNIELQILVKETDHTQEVSRLHQIIQDLQAKLNSPSANVSSEEIVKRDAYIQQLEGKLTATQNELKKAQIMILDLENIKLEFAQHKSGVSETVKMYKQQIQELNNRIKEVQTLVFQPVRVSVNPEDSQSVSGLANSVKLYDRTVKHLAGYLNNLTDGMSDSLAHALGLIASVHELKLERCSAERARDGLRELKQLLERQHSATQANVTEIHGALTIFEGIFKDYNELLKKSLTKPEPKPQSASVEQLTSALLARGQELQALEAELAQLKNQKDDCDLLKAQVDLYRSDFEAERESREKMASEKDTLQTDLRTAQRRVQELTTQLEEIRILSPGLHKSVTTKTPGVASPARPSSTPARVTPVRATPVRATPARATPASAIPAASSANVTMYKCPKCMNFSSDQYAVMEEHFDFCLDDF